MKKLLLLVTIITGFAACKNDPDPIEKTGAVQLLPSVAAYANNANSDTSAAAPVQMAARVDNPPAKIIYITRERIIDKTKAPVTEDIAPIVPSVVPENTGTANTNADATTAQQNAGEVNTGETSTEIPQPEKKKGWSKAAEGAAIGGVTGAIGGAVISKKKGLGAVIGGVVGAAGGYIIGKGMDKKDNRFNIE